MQVNRFLLTFAVMAATIMQVLDTTITNVALPHMAGELGATSDSISWVLTAYVVAASIFMPLTGYLTDRLGRRRYLLISITGCVVARDRRAAARARSRTAGGLVRLESDPHRGGFVGSGAHRVHLAHPACARSTAVQSRRIQGPQLHRGLFDYGRDGSRHVRRHAAAAAVSREPARLLRTCGRARAGSSRRWYFPHDERRGASGGQAQSEVDGPARCAA